jgi:hypothetical protein
VYVTVLAVFAHHLEGPGSAIHVVRGLQIGLFGTIVFFLVINASIERLGIAVAFGTGLVAVVMVQTVSLRLLRRPVDPAVGAP